MNGREGLGHAGFLAVQKPCFRYNSCFAENFTGETQPYNSLPVPGGACRKDGEGLFTRVCSDRTRGNGSKLKEGRFRLDIRKKSFPMRVVKPWPRLPREAVAVPSLAVLKARLDGALSNIDWWKMSLLMAGGWNQMSFKVTPNPNHSVIL